MLDKKSDVLVLPYGFHYENIRGAEELRAVLPELVAEESVVTFGFRADAGNKIDSINLTYSIGGNATLELINGKNETYSLYTIQPASDPNYKLQTVVIRLREPVSSVSAFACIMHQ